LLRGRTAAKKAPWLPPSSLPLYVEPWSTGRALDALLLS
jgi:hypothetical protein